MGENLRDSWGQFVSFVGSVGCGCHFHGKGRQLNKEGPRWGSFEDAIEQSLWW